MSQMSVLRRKALEIAAGQALSNDDPFGAYEDLVNYIDSCNSRGRTASWADIDHVLPWQAYEDLEPLEVLALIEDPADIIEQAFRDVLCLAKEGIVEETIAGRLDSDMNTLDMAALVQIGAQSQAAEDQAESIVPARPRF